MTSPAGTTPTWRRPIAGEHLRGHLCSLYALLDADDQSHRAAARVWPRLLGSSEAPWTTNYVLVESCALVPHRLGDEALRVLLDDIMPVLSVHWITPEEHQAATAAVLAANRRDLSLVDCVSFEAMRGLGVEQAFAFDRHFHQHGFRAPR